MNMYEAAKEKQNTIKLFQKFIKGAEHQIEGWKKRD